jgi:hypothetical protein
MMLGDPRAWKRRLVTLDERILQRVLSVWSGCVGRLQGQPEEDDITINLVDLLVNDPVVFEKIFCFSEITNHAIFAPSRPTTEGRFAIVT